MDLVTQFYRGERAFSNLVIVFLSSFAFFHEETQKHFAQSFSMNGTEPEKQTKRSRRNRNSVEMEPSEAFFLGVT
jgi:hypothetical protein